MPDNNPVTFQKIALRPGLYRDTTSYADEGGWYSCDKIRFRSGSAEKIGGWTKLSSGTYQGTASLLFNWVDLSNNNYIAVFTNLKVYIIKGGTYFDITPIRSTTAAGDVTFAAVNGSTTITVSDTSHGANVGDFVTFSGAVSLGGVITAVVLNQEYQITTVINANSYTITSAVAANASDSGNGGGATVGTYQIHVGLAVYVPGTGWGAGTWGRGTWGSASATTTVGTQLRTWSADNFGEDLVFADRGGGLYQWVAANGTGTRAVLISSMVGASDVPTIVNGVLVTEQRQVVVWGSNAIGSGTLDPLFIRWSTTESTVNWTPSVTNTAGGYRLSAGSSIISGLKARQEVLFWTDSDVYSMQYVGGDLIYGFQFYSHNTSIAAPHSMASANNVTYWMGLDKFYMYNGVVNTLQCTVWQQVFQNINISQSFQFVSGTNEGFNEIIWFYCSANSTTNDSYVIYNYAENLWYYGTLARSAWLDSPLQATPMAATSNYLVFQENGLNDENGMGFTAFLESGDFDIGDGYRFAFITRLLPDVNFTGSTLTPASVTITLKIKNSSGGVYSASQTNASTVVTTLNVDQYTDQAQVRIRGRQGVFRIESSAAGVQWQLGNPRLQIQPDGRQ